MKWFWLIWTKLETIKHQITFSIRRLSRGPSRLESSNSSVQARVERDMTGIANYYIIGTTIIAVLSLPLWGQKVARWITSNWWMQEGSLNIDIVYRKRCLQHRVASGALTECIAFGYKTSLVSTLWIICSLSYLLQADKREGTSRSGHAKVEL